MRKTVLALLFMCSFLLANAQIAAVKLKKGDTQSQVKDIIVVFKMHFDIGYTDWAEGILQKYTGEMLRETLEQIDKTYHLPKEEQFIWTVPAWPLKYIIDHCDVKYKASLDRALQSGRITPHALPLTYETEASDYETLVRGLKYADQIRRKYHRPLARYAKLTDVPSHSHILPTLLKNAGIDFLHIGCNPGSKSPDIPVLSFWEGPDKSRILLMNWAEYYGSGILPPENWPHKTWLAMIHTHENSGAPTAEQVEALLKEAKEKMPNAHVKIGELEDFYDALMKEKPQLPILKGDMPDTWIHGYSSVPRATKLARSMHRLTYATEGLETLLNLWGASDENHHRAFDKATEQQILFDEHTFGIAMTHGAQQDWSYGDSFQINKSLGHYDYAETSWREKEDHIDQAERIVKPILRNGMKSLATQVACKGKRIVVYNPDPWERSNRVEFFLGVYAKDFTIYALKDLTSGQIIPAFNEGNFVSFDAKEVPSMGYKTYQVIISPQDFSAKTQIDKTKYILENASFKLQVNPQTGALLSLYDKKKKKECVDKHSKYGFSSFVREVFGTDDLEHYNKAYVKKGAENWANQEMGRPYTTNKERLVSTGKVKKIVCKHLGNGARIHVFGEVDDEQKQSYVLTYTLFDNQEYLEINCGINQKQTDACPEAAWLAFPFAVENPDYRVFRLGGIIDPTKDLIDYTNQYYYYINSSLALIDASQGGWALDAPDAPGISLDAPGLFNFGKHFTPKTGLVFANLYNTQWGTNFTEWIQGSFNIRYRIRSFSEYKAEKVLVTPSEEVRTPLFAGFADVPKGRIPTQKSGIQLDKKGIYLTAFKRVDNGWLVRLWEQTGKDQEVTLTFPKALNISKVQACNLRDVLVRDTFSLMQNRKLHFSIKANQPKSFLLLEK